MVLSIAAFALDGAIRDISVDVALRSDGSARIHERWDVRIGDGTTEWYLAKSGLGDIAVRDFEVFENGARFTDQGSWDVSRTLSEKAGRSGIVRKADGVELCWGTGSPGDHVFDVYYTMTNAVKTLNDYDMLHLQLVSPGLSSRPEHVAVSIGREGGVLSDGNSRLWGFGFEGRSAFAGGRAVFESTARFRSKSSVIVLLRFDKGLFHSPSVQNRNFQAVLDKALDGASFKDDEGNEGAVLGLLYFLMTVLSAGLAVFGVKASRKNVVGMKPKDVMWSRDIPYGGDLVKTSYTLGRLGEIRKQNTMAAALILRMIYNGQLSVVKTPDDKIEISFSEDASKLAGLSPEARGLYDMMKEASGSDRILQDKEFSRWSSRHNQRIRRWAESYELRGSADLRRDGDIQSLRYTVQGQENARKALGFKKFLQDFTLMKEKGSIEVNLWREYLVFGALFGIADKVAAELKDIDVRVFEESGNMDFFTTYQVVRMSDVMSRAITNARVSGTGGSRSGLGGFTSFGGGGGFSGGGFGGGAR